MNSVLTYNKNIKLVIYNQTNINNVRLSCQSLTDQLINSCLSIRAREAKRVKSEHANIQEYSLILLSHLLSLGNTQYSL